jgi:hypothetical protein
MIDPIDAAIKIAGSGLETQSARLVSSRKIWRMRNPRVRRLALILTRRKP